MAEDNLKDFVVSWTIFGLLAFCLTTFTIIFMADNNPIGLDSDGTGTVLGKTNSNLSIKLYAIEGSSNDWLNVTSKTNPEISQLGSRDSVATSYGTYETSKSYWEQSKLLISWVLVGDAGKVLIGVFSGLLGFLGIYYITKWIRVGA